MRIKFRVIILVLLILWMCTSCIDLGTKYKPSGLLGYLAGGYNSKKLEDNTYRVWFLYNGFTELSTVKNYLLYRCAEITIENEKRYFAIKSEKSTRIPLKLEYVITISDTMFDENKQGYEAQKVIDTFGYRVKDAPSEPQKNKWLIGIVIGIVIFIAFFFISSFLDPLTGGMERSQLSHSEPSDDIRRLYGELTYCLEIGDVAGRVRVCRAALKILEAKPGHDPEIKKEFQENLAIPLLMKPFGRAENIDEAITLLKSVLEYYNHVGDISNQGKYSHNLGYAYYLRLNGERVQNLCEAQNYLQEALSIREQHGTQSEIANTNESLGNVFHDATINKLKGFTNPAKKAIVHYNKALSLFSSQHHPEKWGKIQYGLGNMYISIRQENSENLDKAIHHWNLALGVITEVSSPKLWALIRSNIDAASRLRVQKKRTDENQTDVSSLHLAQSHHDSSFTAEGFLKPKTPVGGGYMVTDLPRMKGSMGVVYVCADKDIETIEEMEADDTIKYVALKTVHPKFLSKEFRSNRPNRDRFLHEGEAWVRLGRHPHIVQAHAVSRDAGSLTDYIIMEYVAKKEGRKDASLLSWLCKDQAQEHLKIDNSLDVETALIFALQIVRGMKHAAEVMGEGFAHRDLKPANILVGRGLLPSGHVNRVRVTDFGLVAILEESAGKETSDIDHSEDSQLTKKSLGTQNYRAPELWQGCNPSVATDVYAFGLILYEMLSGEPAVPFHDKDLIKNAHCEGEIEPLSEDIPPKVVKLVERCRAVKPEERYSNWREVEDALSNVYQEVTGQSVPEPMSPHDFDQQERLEAGSSYNQIGLSYRSLGMPDRAIKLFNRALGIKIESQELAEHLKAGTLGNLGLAYADMRDLKKAAKCDEEALEYNRKAIESHSQALKIHKKLGDRLGEERDLGNLGNVYKDSGDLQQAIEYYEQAFAISKELGDPIGEVNALASMGSANLKRDQPQRAVNYYEQALTISEEIGNHYSAGKILNSLGTAYLQLGKVDEAKAKFKQAIEKLDKISPISERIKEYLDSLKEAYDHLGIACLRSGNPRQAIEYFKQWLESSQKSGNKHGEGAALNSLGIAYLQQGNIQEANINSMKALKIAREIPDRELEGAALNSLGDAYLEQGNILEANTVSMQALEIAREIKDQKLEVDALNRLGIVLAQKGQSEQALENFEQALSIANKSCDRQREGGTLCNLGIMHRRMNKPQQAFECCEKHLIISKELGDKHSEASALGNLGNIYADYGKMRQAITYYEQQLVITQEIGDKIGSANGTFNMAGEYAKLEEWPIALKLAERANQLFSQIGHGSMAKQAQDMAAKIRMRMG